MLSKNFLEDKRANQKNLFEKDPNEKDQKRTDGRSQNFDELMQSLKEQLMELDFVQEIETSEAYQEFYIEENLEEEYEMNSQSSPDFTQRKDKLSIG